jgi:serine/threonine-protein kinase
MIELTLLGAPDLRDADGNVIPAVVVQPKRLALLTYLALGGTGRFHQRDTLLALFWPDLDSERARNGLNKSVHFLRSALGEDTILSRGERELGLNAARFNCDALRFETAATAGRHAEAMELYRGDLLPGFFLTGAPEFERWLEDTRTRLRRLAVTSALSLTAEARATGTFGPAIRWARRAGELAPTDEPVIRELVQALALAGDRVGAVRAFEDWSVRLEREVGVQPSAETVALIESLRRAPGPVKATVLSGDEARSPTPMGPAEGTVTPARRSPSLVRLAILTGLALPIVLAMVWTKVLRLGSIGEAPRPPTILVLPFHTAGDTALGYLGDGMVDLLAATLSGPGGLRTVDPYAAVSAWNRRSGEADSDHGGDSLPLRLSRTFNATWVVTGSVVGHGPALSIDATIRRVSDGRVSGIGRASGPVDSLTHLVDDIAAQLLIRQVAGEAAPAAHSGGIPLQAVRAYLEGRAAYRRGEYRAAVTASGRALDADSSFGQAAFDGMLAASVLPDAAAYVRAKHLAWEHQGDLSPAERILLRAMAGPDYPQPFSGADRLLRLDSAATIAPDRPDFWFMFGDLLYHEGPALGTPDARARSAAAFERALALDPSYEAPLEHLFDLAATDGDQPRARALGARYLALHGTSDRADYVRWRTAAALGDLAALRTIQEAFETMSLESLSRIAGVSQLDGVGVEDGDAAIAVYVRRAASLSERRDWWLGAQLQQMFLARNRGRLREAGKVFEALYQEDTRTPSPSAHVSAAMMGGGPVGVADSEAAVLVASLDSAVSTPPLRLAGQAQHFCIAAHWELSEGQTRTAEHIASVLSLVLRDSSTAIEETQAALCMAGLVAALAAIHHDHEAPVLLDRFDSLATARVPGGSYRSLANLEIARLREAAGDPEGALRAVRRRPYHWIPDGLVVLSAYLFQEGRLAERTGDVQGARAAFRHYLALRDNPDPELRAEADSARAALGRLDRRN